MANVSSADLKRSALGLAINGFTVFPVKPGDKFPPLVKFTRQATADPNEVEQMWRRHPEANIGVYAGPGTVIVDADLYKNPRCLDGLEIPETTTVRSASGGRHFYLLGSSSTRTDVRLGLGRLDRDGAPRGRRRYMQRGRRPGFHRERGHPQSERRLRPVQLSRSRPEGIAGDPL